MNPRKRRAIARAIVAGIPKSKLNSENIRKFLKREKEKGRLNLTAENIEDIIFPNGFVNKPVSETRTVEEVQEEVQEVQEDLEVAEVTVETEDQEELSLDNTKAELQAAAENLGISFKKSFSKSKLLELINNN